MTQEIPTLPTLKDIKDLQGKRVLVRASLNVPLIDGVVRDAFRLRSAVATLTYLRERGACIVLIGHIGRDKEETLLPVYTELSKMIPLAWCGDQIGDEVLEMTNDLEDGDILMLENLRSYEGETQNDDGFARTLASLADVYVNDAFADSHRAHASIAGVTKYLKGYAGVTFLEEYTQLSKTLNPTTPALFILGGAKFETKLPLIEKFLNEYDHIFVGGALANDILKAKGYEVGTSLVSDIDLSDSSLITHEKILIPVDVTVDGPRGIRTVDLSEVASDESILDAGPKTMELLANHISDAKTILWNGPIGNYEKGFGNYSEACARLIALSSAYSVIGGGDTVAVVESLGADEAEKFNFLSTAGGAMLTYLEEGTLPGIDALRSSGS